MELQSVPVFDEQATSRLGAMGLSESVLLEAARAGQDAADTCTANDPTSVPGILWWAKGTRTLRELLIPQGWRRADHENYPTVVHPDEMLAIAVVAGNHRTGQETANPTTQRKKGPATKRAVEQNQVTFTAEDDPAFKWPALSGQAVPTWLLLHHTDEEREEIRTELSLPAAYSDGFVTAWAERIILPVISLQSAAESSGDQDDDSGDIDIDISRR